MIPNGTNMHNNPNLSRFLNQSAINTGNDSPSRSPIINTPPITISPPLNSPSLIPSQNNQESLQSTVTPSNIQTRLSLDNLTSTSPIDHHQQHKSITEYHNHVVNHHFIQNNQHDFIRSSPPNQYTTSPPLKKSFCIDALLAKNQENNNHHDELVNPDINRFMREVDNARNEYDRSVSPDDGNLSR